MDEDVKNFYAGIYQAYAWHQGHAGKVVRFRIPSTHDKYCMTFRGDNNPVRDFDFCIKDFMQVVADIDDGGIHYWRHEHYQGDDFLWLACTEDDSMIHISNKERESYHTCYEEVW